MKKKIILIGIIISVFLIGIVSAGLLDFFGEITTTITVKGPVFYANSETINLDGEQVKKLSINEFNDSTANYTIKNGDSEKFWTEKFDKPLDFYNPEVKLYVRAKIVKGNIPKELDLIFGYYKGDNTYEICRGNVSIDSNETLKQYSTTCQGDSELEDIEGFYYEIKGKATPSVEIIISLENQETKVEIIGVAKENSDDNDDLLEINILNVNSTPVVEENWTVMFNTTGKANLTITAFNGTNWTNYSESGYDLKFLEIKCGEQILTYQWIKNSPDDGSVFIQDYECNETAYEISKVLTQGIHILEFNFGGIKIYAYNTATAGSLNNSNGTQGGGGESGNENIEVNVSEVNITAPTVPENVSLPEEVNVTLPEIEEANATESSLEQPVTEQPIAETENIEQPANITEEEIVETEEEQIAAITETENTEQLTEQLIAPTEEIIQEENKNTEIVPEDTSEPQTEENSETNSQDNENNERG